MSNQVYSHSPIWWGGKSLHGFVKNLDEKFFRITLDKDYGHYLRVIICLFRPDFPQIPCPTDFSRIIGLERDYLTLKRQDQDGFEQAIITAISTKLGADLCQFVKVLFHVVENKHVCRLIINASPHPVFLKQGKLLKFYLRTGGGTRDLNIKEAVDFIIHRWH